MLAPYNNLASSVATALVPTLLNPKIKDAEITEPATLTNDLDKNPKGKREMKKYRYRSNIFLNFFYFNIIDQPMKITEKEEQVQKECDKSPCKSMSSQDDKTIPKSTVPEVYVRPPTPTPSATNLPIITVSSPSRRSSVASRRNSDASRTSRRNSECSVRFINEEDGFTSECRRNSDFSSKHSPEIDRRRSPDKMSRRYSENVTPLGNIRDLRRCSDFSHEKNRSSQFAAKLKRNSDFGNRTPRRMLPPTDLHKLPKVVDLSPTGRYNLTITHVHTLVINPSTNKLLFQLYFIYILGSRRNSDVSGFTSRAEIRRNSDISFRRNSEFVQVKPLDLNRRSSDISIRSLSRSPTHGRSIVPEKIEIQEKSESDSDQPDCSEKAALMTEKSKDKDDDGKLRKKNLSWKNEKEKEDVEDITVETNLLPENTKVDGKVGVFLFHFNVCLKN